MQCTFNYVSNAIVIVVSYLVGYIAFKAAVGISQLYGEETCISIESTLEEVRVESGSLIFLWLLILKIFL